MIVYYGATRNLYPYLQGAIRSLLDHNDVSKLYIAAEDDKLPFEILCEHEVLNVSGQQYYKSNCPNLNSQFTYMAMMRACLPELIQEDKVLVLDVDTIVCDSLEPIWDIDLTGNWLAWCPEHFGNYKPYGPQYYNIGVAVMNLEQMRRDGFTDTAVALLNKIPFRYTDQCVFNILAVPNHSVDIDIRYNESFCCGFTDNPAVVHFAGFRNWYENRQMYRWEYLEKYMR